MGAGPSSDGIDDLSTVGHVKSQDQGAVGNGDVVGQRPLSCAHGAGNHLGHPCVTLEASHVGRSLLPDAYLGHQSRHGRKGHSCLAQRRQDLFDVAEEQGVRSDHQNALPFEGEPVGIEEVGGPVERHCRLTGARTTLNHQHAGQRGADDLVLLALDGGNDVGHPTRAGPVESSEQGRRSPNGQIAHDELTAGVAVTITVREVIPVAVGRGTRHSEALVLQPHHPAAVEGQVTAKDQALRVAAGGPVERFGNRGTPVHHQRVVACTVDGQSSDVERLGVGPVRRIAVVAFVQTVDPTEGQGLVTDVQLLESGHRRSDDDIPLRPGLESPAPAQVQHAFEHRIGVTPHGVQACVGHVYELLLALQLRLHPHLRSTFPRQWGTLDCIRLAGVVVSGAPGSTGHGMEAITPSSRLGR